MNTMTRFAVVAVLAAMNLGGCVGAPEGELDSLTQEATASTTTPATDEGSSLAGAVAPSPLSSCLLAATHDFTGSSVDLFLDLLDTTADVSTPFTVAFNTAAGTCFFNAAEAGYGVRVNGRFRITTPIVLHHNVTASVVASPTTATRITGCASTWATCASTASATWTSPPTASPSTAYQGPCETSSSTSTSRRPPPPAGPSCCAG
nr:hypothetical protein [Deltaproteobacteria bacterium]